MWSPFFVRNGKKYCKKQSSPCMEEYSVEDWIRCLSGIKRLKVTKVLDQYWPGWVSFCIGLMLFANDVGNAVDSHLYLLLRSLVLLLWWCLSSGILMFLLQRLCWILLLLLLFFNLYYWAVIYSLCCEVYSCCHAHVVAVKMDAHFCSVSSSCSEVFLSILSCCCSLFRRCERWFMLLLIGAIS